MIFILTNCVASYIVVGSSPTAAARAGRRAARRARLRRDQRADRHLRPAAADRHDDRHRLDLLRHRALAAAPARQRREFNSDLADWHDRQARRRHSGEPRRSSSSSSSSIWVPFRRSALGRAAYATGSSEVAAYMSGVPIRRAKFAAYTLSGLLSAIGGLYPHLRHLFGRGLRSPMAAPTRSTRSPRWCSAASRSSAASAAPSARSSARSPSAPSAISSSSSIVEPLWQPLFQGVVLLLAVCVGSARLFQIRNRLDLFG